MHTQKRNAKQHDRKVHECILMKIRTTAAEDCAELATYLFVSLMRARELLSEFGIGLLKTRDLSLLLCDRIVLFRDQL
jgi:hypothetical protein